MAPLPSSFLQRGLSLATLALSLAIPAALAQTTAPTTPPPVTTTDERLLQLGDWDIIGSREAERLLPGAGTYLDLSELPATDAGDINRVLRQVPGVYVREEDGNGLFNNLSLRGADGHRSAKLMILEDGIPAAPAPYSAPEAYYSPNSDRMSAIEVLKGSSQIRQGPHNTGGVINYRSTRIPRDPSGYLKLTLGDTPDYRTHLWYGGETDTEIGRVGALIEFYHRDDQGFREIGETPDFNDGDETGFTRTEPMLKLSWVPSSDTAQRFELMVAHTEVDADETYLGLNEADLRDDPTQRYAATRFDNMRMRQTRAYLRHTLELPDELTLRTTVYAHQFHRNWYKLRRINDGTRNINLSEALLTQSGLAVLKGEAAGRLDYRNNNRDYQAYGIESVLDKTVTTGEVTHQLSLGVRYHTDYVDRDQNDTSYTQAANGTITDFTQGPEGAAGDGRDTTDAVALYVEDAMTIGRLTVTPGVRFEWLSFEHDNRLTGLVAESDLTVVAPGLGLSWAQDEQWTFFGGIYRGFSTPGVEAHAVQDIEEEISNNFELGARYAQGPHAAELVGFYTQYRNLIVLDNLAAGSPTSENVGDVNSYGLELKLATDLGETQGWSFKNPWWLAATYTHSRLDGDSNSANAESIFAGGADGNEVPYIPELQVSLGSGIEVGKFRVELSGTWFDETYSTASNTDDQINPNNGLPDARFGTTDSALLVDAKASYRLRDNAKVFVQALNLLDEEYISSRHPEGPRAGRPLTFLAGVEMTF